MLYYRVCCELYMQLIEIFHYDTLSLTAVIHLIYPVCLCLIVCTYCTVRVIIMLHPTLSVFCIVACYSLPEGSQVRMSLYFVPVYCIYNNKALNLNEIF